VKLKQKLFSKRKRNKTYKVENEIETIINSWTKTVEKS